MPAIALPEPDLARILEFCGARVPARLHDKIRVEAEIDGRAVTIVERRPPWRPEYGPEWSRAPIARLRHSATSGLWTLYWSDRHGRFHRYDLIKPSRQVGRLLAEVAADPTSIFWG